MRRSLHTSDRASDVFVPEVLRRETFGDDTSTGRLRVARRARRAIVAASVDGRDHDWWDAFRKDYFPGLAEVKSGDVLRLVQSNAEARTRLLSGLADAKTVIVIIDFSELTASLVRAVYEEAGMRMDGDPLDILERRQFNKGVTEAIIRYSHRARLEESAVSRIEWLWHEAVSEAPVIIDDEPLVLVNRDAYDKLDPKAKDLFLAHFAVAFAEALDPRRQANLLAIELGQSRFFDLGNLAYKRLEDTLTVDRTYDHGSSRTIRLLTEAHEQMVTTLDEAMHNQLKRRAGAIREEDSQNAVGIQIADVAAGFAATEYEAAAGEVTEKAARIRAMFDRVLLNDTWT